MEDLKCFADVVQHGGFSAAERSTGERKANLSRRVQRLEAELGMELIKRSTRSVQVTEFGQAVLEQWDIISRCLEKTKDMADQFKSGVSGNLRVSCPPGIARFIGANSIFEFMKKYPEVNLELNMTVRDVDLVRERFDIAISASPKERNDQSLIMRKLLRPRKILVATPEFLAEFSEIDFASLVRLPILSVGDNVTSTSWILCNEEGETRTIHHHPRFISNDSGGVLDAALQHMGIALLWTHTCQTHLESGALQHILPEWQSQAGRICIYFTNKKWLSSAARAFIEHVANVFA